MYTFGKPHREHQVSFISFVHNLRHVEYVNSEFNGTGYFFRLNQADVHESSRFTVLNQ